MGHTSQGEQHVQGHGAGKGHGAFGGEVEWEGGCLRVVGKEYRAMTGS